MESKLWLVESACILLHKALGRKDRVCIWWHALLRTQWPSHSFELLRENKHTHTCTQVHFSRTWHFYECREKEDLSSLNRTQLCVSLTSLTTKIRKSDETWKKEINLASWPLSITKEKGTRAHSIALTDKRIKYPAGTSKGKNCCLTKGIICQHTDFWGNCRGGGGKQVSLCDQSYHLAFLDSHWGKDLETIHLVWADNQFVCRRKEKCMQLCLEVLNEFFFIIFFSLLEIANWVSILNQENY